MPGCLDLRFHKDAHQIWRKIFAVGSHSRSSILDKLGWRKVYIIKVRGRSPQIWVLSDSGGCSPIPFHSSLAGLTIKLTQDRLIKKKKCLFILTKFSYKWDLRSDQGRLCICFFRQRNNYL